jgi:hypothetical protein
MGLRHGATPVDGDFGRGHHKDGENMVNSTWGPPAPGMHQRGPVMRGGCGGGMELDGRSLLCGPGVLQPGGDGHVVEVLAQRELREKAERKSSCAWWGKKCDRPFDIYSASCGGKLAGGHAACRGKGLVQRQQRPVAGGRERRANRGTEGVRGRWLPGRGMGPSDCGSGRKNTNSKISNFQICTEFGSAQRCLP